MDLATLFIDLWRNVRGFFLNEDGNLDKTRFISGSIVLLFLLGAISCVTYRYFS